MTPIEVRKLTMKELWAIRQATGRSVIAELSVKDAEVDEQMTAALVWVIRRRTSPKLAFESVFSTLTIDELGGPLVIDLGGSDG